MYEAIPAQSPRTRRKRPRLSVERFERVVASYYDAAVDMSLWPGALRKTLDLIGNAGTHLFLLDQRTQLVSYTIHLGMPDELLSEYNSDVIRICPRYRNAQLAPGEILLFDYQHEDERSIDRSEYYEWLQEKGQGIRYYLGGRIITADGSDGFLSLAFRKREGHATETQMRLFGLLMPHVSRAIRIGQRLATWNLKREISLAALEALGCGLILLSSRSQVVFSNPAAHRILSAQDGLTLRADGLRAADSDVNERLLALQRRLMRGRIVHGSQRIRVPKISGGLEYVVEVFRLGRDVEVVHEARPVVAIFISDASRSSGIDAASFRSHYGLSPAEIELAADLATGLPVAQIAVNHRQSIHTVRSQLKGILRKTQAHRQAELARLLSHVSFQPQTTPESR